MLRRVIQRTRLHLPAPIGHDNGAGDASDGEDFPGSPNIAYTCLRDDASVHDYFRQRPENTSDTRVIVAENSAKTRKRHVAELSLEEQKRAADAWARLQTIYGLFRELEASASGDTEFSDAKTLDNINCGRRPAQQSLRRNRCDDGLRSLLQQVQLRPGVIFRDLQTLSMADAREENAMPLGFTASMFAALGNAMYNEMLVAAEQNRICPDAFEKLGEKLYAEATSVVVSTA
ncbi:hypothetical protein CCR75_007886 [Bremia lactucae]|uniref:Uncharacterized protein n=1 Tax=Bremia lactucae TaxID=4779 RepID=A0A976FML9_BRELC|nr:hypothetical protein CCR75_007886 [Bremia lactucae]